jgi:cytidylate kinase
MIITIDGPAGAGKSSVARALAGRMGFRFLDTGAVYRATCKDILNAPEGTVGFLQSLREELRTKDLPAASGQTRLHSETGRQRPLGIPGEISIDSIHFA